MLSLFVLNTIYVKDIPKQVNIIRFSQSVTRAQLSDRLRTPRNYICVIIQNIYTIIRLLRVLAVSES